MSTITGTITKEGTPIADIRVVAVHVTDEPGEETIVASTTTAGNGTYTMEIMDFHKSLLIYAMEDTGKKWVADTVTNVGDKVYGVFKTGDTLWPYTTVRITGDGDWKNYGSSGDGATEGDVQITSTVSKFGGECIDFTTSGASCITIPGDSIYDDNQEITSDLTLELWFYANSIAGSEKELIGNYWNGRGLWIHINSSEQIRMYGTDRNAGGKFNNTSTATIAADQWYHLAIVKRGWRWTSYLDGVEIGTTTQSGVVQGASATPGDAGNYLRIGKGQHDNNYAFNGYIDDVRVTKYARYTENFTPPTAAHPLGDDIGRTLTCTTAGTTGSTPPPATSWDINGSTNDGTVVWATSDNFQPLVEGPFVPEFDRPDSNNIVVTRNGGTVSILEYSAGSWNETHILNTGSKDAYDRNNWTKGTLDISGDGNTIIAVDPQVDTGYRDSGRQYIITKENGTWSTEVIDNHSYGIIAGDYWGWGSTVGINYDGTVIALSGYDDRGGIAIRRKIDDTWNIYHLSGTFTGSRFGKAPIDNSGNVVVVHSQNYYRFHIYRWNGKDNYVLDNIKNIASSISQWGATLSRDGTTYYMLGSGDYLIYVFKYTGYDWDLDATIPIPTGVRSQTITVSSDEQKIALSYNGTTSSVMVGTDNHDGTWSWVTGLRPPIITNSNIFGWALDFNQDGTRLYASQCVDSHWWGSTMELYEMREEEGWTTYHEIVPAEPQSGLGHVIATPRY